MRIYKKSKPKKKRNGRFSFLLALLLFLGVSHFVVSCSLNADHEPEPLGQPSEVAAPSRAASETGCQMAFHDRDDRLESMTTTLYTLEANLHDILDASHISEQSFSDPQVEHRVERRLVHDMAVLRNLVLSGQVSLQANGTEAASSQANSQAAAYMNSTERDGVLAPVHFKNIDFRPSRPRDEDEEIELVIAGPTKGDSVFVAVGSMDQLLSMGLVRRKSGLAGAMGGRKPNLTTQTLDACQPFSLQQRSFAINAKRARILTDHPDGSYEIIKEGNILTELRVLDPERFWRSRRLLIVETK